MASQGAVGCGTGELATAGGADAGLPRRAGGRACTGRCWGLPKRVVDAYCEGLFHALYRRCGSMLSISRSDSRDADVK